MGYLHIFALGADRCSCCGLSRDRLAGRPEAPRIDPYRAAAARLAEARERVIEAARAWSAAYLDEPECSGARRSALLDAVRALLAAEKEAGA